MKYNSQSLLRAVKLGLKAILVSPVDFIVSLVCSNFKHVKAWQEINDFGLFYSNMKCSIKMKRQTAPK